MCVEGGSGGLIHGWMNEYMDESPWQHRSPDGQKVNPLRLIQSHTSCLNQKAFPRMSLLCHGSSLRKGTASIPPVTPAWDRSDSAPRNKRGFSLWGLQSPQGSSSEMGPLPSLHKFPGLFLMEVNAHHKCGQQAGVFTWPPPNQTHLHPQHFQE